MKLGSSGPWQQGPLPTEPSLQPLSILSSFKRNVVYQVLVQRNKCTVGCAQPWSPRQRFPVRAAQVIQDSSTHALSPRPMSFSYRPACHFSVSEFSPALSPSHCLNLFMTFAALFRDSLLKRSVYPCVCMCTHMCVCVCREKKVLLCCCYDVRAESHSPLQSFPSSDAAISRLLIKRH